MGLHGEGFETLSRHFPEDWRSKAGEHGLSFGTGGGAKLNNIGELLQIFLHQVANDLSLDSAVAWGAALGLPEISKVALHKRVRKLGPYLRWMLQEMLEANREYAPERWGGYELRVVDGTTVVRPGHDRATSRVLYVMRLSDLRVTELHVTDDSVGETFERIEEEQLSGQLYVADRAYSSPPGIRSLCDREADVLVRYNWASLPLTDSKGNRFDVFEKLPSVSEKRPREWRVRIRNGPGWIHGRLIVQALPPKEAKRARAKIKAERKTPSQNTLLAAGYRMIFTTAPVERLSAKAVLALYSLRWQVELQIKRDKSIFALKCLPNFRLDTIQSWLYAKLILAHLTRRIADEAIEDLPPCAEESLEAA